jgi:hypothetical protein
METDDIEEVRVDEKGRLCLRPARATFSYIYREAIEVEWEPYSRTLRSPGPREWGYPRWFQQVAGAARESGCRLMITPSTQWVNVSDDDKAAMLEIWASLQTADSSIVTSEREVGPDGEEGTITYYSLRLWVICGILCLLAAAIIPHTLVLFACIVIVGSTALTWLIAIFVHSIWGPEAVRSGIILMGTLLLLIGGLCIALLNKCSSIFR